MPEFRDRFSSRQQRALKTIPDSAYEGRPSDTLEEYGQGKATFAERINNTDTSALDRLHLLTEIFERRRNSILNTIRSVHTKNLASLTEEDIRNAMEGYENQLGAVSGAKSDLQDYFQDGVTEAMLAGGLYHIVDSKETFLQILAKEIHDDLFRQTEFFKNVSGVLAMRLNAEGGTEVLLVRSKKTGIWQFPGGKAEHVAIHPTTGKKEIVSKKDDIWQFADGTAANEDNVVLEEPDECLRREISEELGEDVGDATLSTSGFYSIGGSRFLIHGFVANNLTVDPDKVKPEEIDRIMWTSSPLEEREDDGRNPIKLTDQTKDVLERFFHKGKESTHGK